jgi:hypothetical protein
MSKLAKLILILLTVMHTVNALAGKKRKPASLPIQKIMVYVESHTQASVVSITKESTATVVTLKTAGVNRTARMRSEDFALILSTLEAQPPTLGGDCGEAPRLRIEFFKALQTTPERTLQECYTDKNRVSKDKVELLRDITAIVMI